MVVLRLYCILHAMQHDCSCGVLEAITTNYASGWPFAASIFLIQYAVGIPFSQSKPRYARWSHHIASRVRPKHFAEARGNSIDLLRTFVVFHRGHKSSGLPPTACHQSIRQHRFSSGFTIKSKNCDRPQRRRDVLRNFYSNILPFQRQVVIT